MDLGQILLQMMSGAPAQPVMPVAPMGRTPARQAPENDRTMTRTQTPSLNTGEKMVADTVDFVNSWLARETQESDRRRDASYSDNSIPFDRTEIPAETSTPKTLKRPGPDSAPYTQTATPARGNAELQGLPPISVPPQRELTPFDVYGAPVPTRRPLDLGQMMFGQGESPPLPDRRPAAGAPASPAVPTPAAKAPGRAPASAAGASPSTGKPTQGRGAQVQAQPPVPLTPPAPNTDSPFHGTALMDPITQKFLLQTGLSLMTPQWGGPLSNIGQAIGDGAEAVTRAEKIQREDDIVKKKLELEQARINKIGLGRGKKGASESSGSKRLKEKTPMQQFASTLSPEGSIFFTQRIKDLNKLDAEAGETADAKMQRIMQETQAVDRRARASRGQARSEEIPDDLLRKVAGTPQETTALNAVAADPVQRALVVSRLEAMKAQKAAKPNG